MVSSKNLIQNSSNSRIRIIIKIEVRRKIFIGFIRSMIRIRRKRRTFLRTFLGINRSRSRSSISMSRRRIFRGKLRRSIDSIISISNNSNSSRSRSRDSMGKSSIMMIGIKENINNNRISKVNRELNSNQMNITETSMKSIKEISMDIPRLNQKAAFNSLRIIGLGKRLRKNMLSMNQVKIVILMIRIEAIKISISLKMTLLTCIIYKRIHS